MTESQLAFLPRARMEDFIVHHPMAAVRLIEAMSRAVSVAHRRARLRAVEGAESRIATLLLQLAQTQGNGAAEGTVCLQLDYTRRELAEMVGITAETVSRVLSRLHQEKTIELQRRHVVIRDAERLRQLADEGSAEGSGDLD
jgi:CRP-like cAMP-binding protein